MIKELVEKTEKDRISNLPYFDSFCQIAEKYLVDHEGKYHIVAFDIANFKLINNNYGFSSGDKLINAIVDKTCINNPACIIATRIYSDHIIGLYTTDESKETVFEKVARINGEIVHELQSDYPLVPIHMHSGVYRIKQEDKHITTCIDKANMARKAAKGHYKIECVEYNESFLRAQERVAEVLTALDEGLNNDNILILLQPKINVETKKIVGAEALSRLLDKKGNIIRPDEFIPVLEKTGRILDLDRYVMNKVMDLVEEWYKQGVDDLVVSINMSRVHFYNENLSEDIIGEARKRNLPPALIEFEVTESVFLSDTDMIIEKIDKLRKYGFKISIDDFGAGYSSLNLISILPVDIVKLDRGFIRTSLDTRRGQEIMKGLISMLKNIELGIVCEGIESPEEEAIVYKYGCKEVQGYLYDKPIKIPEFIDKYIKEKLK